jgi:hypothetical protein
MDPRSAARKAKAATAVAAEMRAVEEMVEAKALMAVVRVRAGMAAVAMVETAAMAEEKAEMAVVVMMAAVWLR